MKYSSFLMSFAVIVTLVITVESRCPVSKINDSQEDDGVSSQVNPLGAPITDFSFDFLRALHASESRAGKLKKNLVFSPSNIFRAFLMVSLGTNGCTKKQLNNALHLNTVENVFKQYQTWKGIHVPGVLEADRLYHDSSIEMKEKIKALLTEDIHQVVMDDASTVGEVNQWVSNMTQGNIPNLLSGSLEEVKLLLLSVVYMKADWKKKFESRYTYKTNFKTTDCEKEVDMMYLNRYLEYFYSPSLESQVVALPYEDSRVKFLVFLPNVTAGQTIDGLISSLNRDEVSNTVEGMEDMDVALRLPKFKTENEIDLIPMLNVLGVKDVFTDRANMSGFSDTELRVEKALHKVILKVDEEGTTAAAVTAFNGGFTGSPPKSLKQFRADHPFVYMVYDVVSRMPLFAGVTMDPTK